MAWAAIAIYLELISFLFVTLDLWGADRVLFLQSMVKRGLSRKNLRATTILISIVFYLISIGLLSKYVSPLFPPAGRDIVSAVKWSAVFAIAYPLVNVTIFSILGVMLLPVAWAAWFLTTRDIKGVFVAFGSALFVFSKIISLSLLYFAD